VSDAILKAARAWADALLLGTNAFSSKTLGSVSDGCAQEARCTTIVVKDPRV
jgi:nucleotide-binding universal stress UspA family protein